MFGPSNLLFQFVERLCVLVAMAYALSRGRIFSNLLLYRTKSKESFWILGYFCVLAGLEYFLPPDSAPFIYPTDHTLINLNVLASCSAGLLAGPWVGIGTGVFAGLLGIVLHASNSISFAVASLVSGALGGMIFQFRPHPHLKALSGFLVTFFAQVLRMGLVMAFGNSTAQLDALIILFGVGAVTNGFATGLFLLVVSDIGAQHEKIGRIQINRALQIANKILPHLRPGLNEETAEEIARIILDVADVDAVAVTNTQRVLTHVGAGENHHHAGDSINLPATKQVLEEKKTQVADVKSKIGCIDPNCPLSSAVVAPLSYRDHVIGTVELYQTEERPMNAEISELAVGFAQFLGRYLMESEELQRQTQEASEAQLRALQAQIHPHFLFNTLNTLASLCRFDAKHAETLTIQLGTFFRRTLKRNQGSFISLREELNTVDTYLDIEKARFGDHLQIIREIPEDTLDCQVPLFVIQPLVENAVLHGISRKSGGGILRIKARRRKGWLLVSVHDNGVGVQGREPSSLLKYEGTRSHGMAMMNERLQTLYGSHYNIRIYSRNGEGTVIFLIIPENQRGIVDSEHRSSRKLSLETY